MITHDLTSVDMLYAVNTKKEPAATKSPGFANELLPVTSSTISISNLLELVNRYYPDVISKDVLNHFGRKDRPKSELSDDIKYQDRDGGSESNKKSSSQNVKEQTKYQLRKDIDGETFVDVDSDIIKESDGRSIASVIAEIIKNKFNNLIETNNQLIRINATTNREWRRSNDAINLLKRSPAVYNDKIKSIANADEMLTAAKKWVGEQKYHKKSSNKFVEFARVNNNGYNVAKTTDGRSILYDINKIKNIGHGVVSSNVKSEKTNDKRDSHINPNVSTGRISQFNANVNGSNTKVRDRNTAQIDKDYMSAVERGDLVEQLARENPSLRAKLKKLLDKVISAIRSLRDRIRDNYGATNAYAAELDLKLQELNKARADILAKWEAAVKEGIKTQNARTAAPESNKKGSSQNVKEQARYAKQGGAFFNALTGAEWIKYNHSITTGVDAGLRVSENSILVECENNSEYQYKFVIYDNTFAEKPIKSIYAIGNIDYNNYEAKEIATYIYEVEDRRYAKQKTLKEVLGRHAKKFGYILRRYNVTNGRYDNIGGNAKQNRTNTQDQSYRGRADSETRQYSDRELWNITDDKLNNSN